jgi:demethylmenaquinone methyltransferase/2-methoxy-6-polyprenyl-1,4-benzoquinol methylase
MERETLNSNADQLPPHPTLVDYYGEDNQRPAFVRRLFDSSAASYDAVEHLIGLGTGPWYRKNALIRAGLLPGMRALDVAVGTGLVARSEIKLVEPQGWVIGLDPSMGMLYEAHHNLGLQGIQGLGEQLPLRGDVFDFLSMGYGLRHLADLTATFREFHRVLKPGGKICILELTKPPGRFAYAALRFYLHKVVPLVTRITTRNRDAQLLMRYFWETIQMCVPPEKIMNSLKEAGFVTVRRLLALGLFSEYLACKAPLGGTTEIGVEDNEKGDFFIRVQKPGGTKN